MEGQICDTQHNHNDIEYVTIKDPYGFVYITTNLINGKRYVGQRKFYEKWKNYLGSGVLISKAINKYKRHNFRRDIVAICYSQEELNSVERNISLWFDVAKSKHWYNLVFGGGGTGGYQMSEHTRKRLREVNIGRHHTEEVRKKMSESHKGVPLPESTKISMSKSQMGEKNGFYGKHHSDETKQKISKSRSGIRITENWKQNIIDGQSVRRAVYCIELNELYKGPSEAGHITGVNYRHIGECCKCARHRKTAGGFRWIYADKAVEQNYITQQQLDVFLAKYKTKGE